MDSFQIRKKYLNFFEKHGHTVVPSSSLIPAEDPTLLFTNAGMNQFKDLFLGKEKRSYVRATSSQKCVRAGGKHNDLEQVGFSERHLTFFEMLGNFSFGDYFKKEAISFAWEFLTKDLEMDPRKLYVTIYKSDDQAYEIWNTIIGIPEHRITRLGEKDNFWQMGDTGPCGPCTEIYVDRGIERGCKDDPSCAPGCDNCTRFFEIWNLVFMQYDRQQDGTLQPLKNPGVDTGMGLERVCMALQQKETVFDIDMFATIIAHIEKLTGKIYATSNDEIKPAFRALSDHVRSCSLLIADGCSPSNDGRGYVLRKIIRRAALFAQKLSPDQQLFSQLADSFITYLSPVYPELEISRNMIKSVLTCEIDRFAQNLIQGQAFLSKYIQENKKAGKEILSGEQVFKLYDTYGFPPELTNLIAQEQSVLLDMAGFEEQMKLQQEQSGKKQKDTSTVYIPEDLTTHFIGYEKLECTAKVTFIHKTDDGYAWISTDQSPFYAESGGQASDKGFVTVNAHKFPVLELRKAGNTQSPAIILKINGNALLHSGDTITCTVDKQTREETVKQHTATHLLQAALVKVLGPQVKQAGSSVDACSLRFDFAHHKALTQEQIDEVELLVNQAIQEDIHTNISFMTLEQAKALGAMAFFGEKYNPEKVRVVNVPGFSIELCGGTHASSTGSIGCVKIISEVSLATGTRRIVAVAGLEALKLFQQNYGAVKKLSETFKSKCDEVCNAVAKLQEQYQDALTQIKQLKKQLCKSQIPELIQNIKIINNTPVLYHEIENGSLDELKTMCLELEKQAQGFFFFVGKNPQDQSNSCFLGYVTKSLSNKLDARQLANTLKDACGLRGGGSLTMIQGSGTVTRDCVYDKIITWVS